MEDEDSSSSGEEELNNLMLDGDPEFQDYSPDSSSSEEVAENERINFDKSLPTSHSYLGEGMEELHGRTVHEPDDLVSLPLLQLPGIALIPGQILPLHLFHPQSVSMMKKVLEADRTFGLLNTRNPLARRTAAMTKVGTTAEIFSVKEETEYGISTLRMKAEGRQRFCVLESKRQVDGVLMGKVKILPEVQLSPVPTDGLLFAYKTKPNQMSSTMSRIYSDARNDKWKQGGKRYKERFPKYSQKTLQTSVSAHPPWVYRQYNPYFLMDCLVAEMKKWSENLKTDNLPIDPTEFSHWITANLPLDDKLRLQLLEIDCCTVRLRRQLEIMEKCSVLCCLECGNKIADKNDLFSMSLRGPLGAYVNPGGYVHETVTFYRAFGVRLRGSPSAENSWFDGYAWTIAECSQCMSHMGWRFTACKRGLTPSKFFGLTRASLTPTFKHEETVDLARCFPSE